MYVELQEKRETQKRMEPRRKIDVLEILRLPKIGNSVVP